MALTMALLDVDWMYGINYGPCSGSIECMALTMAHLVRRLGVWH